MRRYNPEKAKSMGEEINRLLEAKFIREIKEATWLSPLVMVEKKDTKIYRMCIDFTALNKHCPKDYFPLPRIDQIIDSTAGCERLSFLDAYSGYNQIRLKVEDKDKTAFITPHGVCCYMTMPFGLKNAGATYQRCMQACLKEQIGRNIEVYVDDIVIRASSPVSSILNNPDTIGRVSLWGITLGPWEIMYQRQSAIKSQVLPDFIAEWTEAQMPELPDLSNSWTIFVDGSKWVSGAGAGVVLVSPQGDRMRYVLRMRFPNPSNNEAEYEAVLHGMRMAKACGATRIKIHGDSNLIAQQVMKECDATCAIMIAYRAMYDKLEGEFEGCEVTHIGRESNEEADNQANVGSRCLPIPPGVFFEEIFECSIKIKPATDPTLAIRSGARQANAAPAAEKGDPRRMRLQ
jgi:ribonuclease HI